MGRGSRMINAILFKMFTLDLFLLSYRVGSVNFSRPKLGHAHDNSADFENVAGAREPSVHGHVIFRFENGQGNQSLFSTHDQNTAKTSQPQAQPTDGWHTIDRAFPRGLQRPEKLKIGSARLSRKKKKANFVDSRKLLFKRLKFKETKHDRFGKRPAATEAEEIDDRSTEADVNALRRSIVFFFLFFYVVV